MESTGERSNIFRDMLAHAACFAACVDVSGDHLAGQHGESEQVQ